MDACIYLSGDSPWQRTTFCDLSASSGISRLRPSLHLSVSATTSSLFTNARHPFCFQSRFVFLSSNVSAAFSRRPTIERTRLQTPMLIHSYSRSMSYPRHHLRRLRHRTRTIFFRICPTAWFRSHWWRQMPRKTCYWSMMTFNHFLVSFHAEDSRVIGIDDFLLWRPLQHSMIQCTRQSNPMQMLLSIYFWFLHSFSPSDFHDNRG